MKTICKYLLAGFLLLGVNGTAFAIAPDEAKLAFISGNNSYEAQDYPAALSFYLQAADGFESAELSYNLGNVCFKLDSIPAAILWYERAKILNPTDKDILHNLALAKQRTYDKVEMKDDAAVRNWWRSQILGVGSDQWAAWALWAVILSMITFAAYRVLRPRSLKVAGFISGVGIAVIALIFMLLASMASQYRDQADSAVIFSAKVEIKSSPNADGTLVFSLHEGTKVEILQEQDDWIEVRLEDGKVGWMQKDGIEII